MLQELNIINVWDRKEEYIVISHHLYLNLTIMLFLTKPSAHIIY